MGDNSTCHKHRADQDSPGLFQNGDAVFQAHHVGWIICGGFTIVATAASFWLINKHLQWYTNKREQRYIVRLLFLVPIYALISFASFLFWNNATPLILVRDAYEAIVLTAFFYLLLVYVSPDPEEQRRIFLKVGLSKANDAAKMQRGEKRQRWMFPLGFIKKKPKDGLYFLQLMKWGVLQYCVIRPTTTLAAVILDYAGYYCEESWSPVWGHIYIVVIISISVTIAMYCLLQLYMPVSEQLKPHRPILKLLSVKAVVFLTFWQATLLASLSMLGVVKGTRYMTAEDINIGIGAILECFEMMIFAFVHIKAFTYKPYRPFYNPQLKGMPPSRTPRFKALFHALDFRETFREIWIGCVYLFDKMRGKEPRPDFGARRAAHYEEAFGQPRPAQPKTKRTAEAGKAKQPQSAPPDGIAVDQQVEVDVAGERQWLGLGDDYGYGLGYFRRERSEGLSVQIEQELQKRGYPLDHPLHLQAPPPNPPPQQPEKETYRRRERSWWRNMYDHISPTGYEKEAQDNTLTPSLPRKLQSKSKLRRQSEAQRTLLQEHDLEDFPPSSSLRHELNDISFNRIQPSDGSSGGSDERDILTPLNTHQDRRRSYRPKRHRHSGSGSSLLPHSQPGPAPPSPQESSIDMAELDSRLHDPDSHLAVPTANYNRSDSLLGRIFPPSEVGSVDGKSRYTDSAYSLPSVSTEAPHGQQVEGDRRRHVHENIYHPSQSANALLSPWSAEVHHHHSPKGVEYGDPPPLPAKDVNYVPSFRRPHRREPAHHPRQRPMDSGSSLPSLPEDGQFTPPLSPYLAAVSKNDTERSSTLVDTPKSPQSAYFSDSTSGGRSSSDWSEPSNATPVGKPVRGDAVAPLDIPPPSSHPSGAILGTYEDPLSWRFAKPVLPSFGGSGGGGGDGGSRNPRPPPTVPVLVVSKPSRKLVSSFASLHKRERAEKQSTSNGPDELLPPQSHNYLRPRPSIDSVDLSDTVSVNTFYTATSQPHSTNGRRS